MKTTAAIVAILLFSIIIFTSGCKKDQEPPIDLFTTQEMLDFLKESDWNEVVSITDTDGKIVENSIDNFEFRFLEYMGGQSEDVFRISFSTSYSGIVQDDKILPITDVGWIEFSTHPDYSKYIDSDQAKRYDDVVIYFYNFQNNLGTNILEYKLDIDPSNSNKNTQAVYEYQIRLKRPPKNH